jgi:hypothetical protein
MNKAHTILPKNEWLISIRGEKLIIGAARNNEFKSLHYVAFPISNSDPRNNLIGVKDLEGLRIAVSEIDMASIT